MTVPEVTVVIPTHNRRVLLGRALRCALGQRGVPLEVVVVDDGSTDDTSTLVAELGDERVRVVRNEAPTGVARARNRGLASVTTTWVAFLDDDDLWAPDRLGAQLDALAENECGWAVSGAVVVDDALRLIGAQRPPRPGALPGAVLRYNCIPGGASGVLASTALVRELGGFDPELSILADWDLWTRLALAAPLVTVSEPHVAYVLHGANMTTTPRGFAPELERVRRKHARARVEHGVAVDEAAWELWFAEVAYRGGARLGPTFQTWRAAIRRRSPRLLARGLSMRIRPGWLERREQARLAAMDPRWRASAEAWLAEHRKTTSNLP
ncbi:MAG: glycosyltransferase family 2 protein [Gaiellales bacterium]